MQRSILYNNMPGKMIGSGVYTRTAGHPVPPHEDPRCQPAAASSSTGWVPHPGSESAASLAGPGSSGVVPTGPANTPPATCWETITCVTRKGERERIAAADSTNNSLFVNAVCLVSRSNSLKMNSCLHSHQVLFDICWWPIKIFHVAKYTVSLCSRTMAVKVKIFLKIVRRVKLVISHQMSSYHLI